VPEAGRTTPFASVSVDDAVAVAAAFFVVLEVSSRKGRRRVRDRP
jgi:hypothetical protein